MVGVKSGREVLEQNLSADPYRALARVKVARPARLCWRQLSGQRWSGGDQVKRPTWNALFGIIKRLAGRRRNIHSPSPFHPRRQGDTATDDALPYHLLALSRRPWPAAAEPPPLYHLVRLAVCSPPLPAACPTIAALPNRLCLGACACRFERLHPTPGRQRPARMLPAQTLNDESFTRQRPGETQWPRRTST